ncbi:MAG: oligosaccharide flippase family protein [Oscillospiraceae bacterium]|nr:oligosaccharide flippase family protein [Oscillospiraceae bacterium]
MTYAKGAAAMAGFRKLAKDTAVLTASSVLMRCIGLAYQVWLAGRIGAAGIGLWQLVTSVSMLSATLAISGIRFTTTRLVSEELGGGNGAGASRAVTHCLGYAALMGCAAFLVLYLCAEPIGFLWIGDARTVKSLRILAFGLPAIALSSVLNGYFIASGRAWRSAAVQVLEQLTGIGCVMALLSRVPGDDLELCCAAISGGRTVADIVSLLLIVALYLLEQRQQRRGAPARLTGRMLRIAIPLALSAYARTSLTTLENLLVPRKLREAGFSAERALGGYGTITGMVFPIIGFPSCLLSALAELTVPELTAAQVRGDTARIDSTVSRLLRWTLAFSLLCAAFLFVNAEALGALIYHSSGVGPYIRVFALLVPMMYMDIVTDGCLKGLGQMMWSMGYNITEAALGTLLVITLLPRWALDGYIFMLFFCEIFNFVLSITRLRRVAQFRLLPLRRRRRGQSPAGNGS